MWLSNAGFPVDVVSASSALTVGMAALAAQLSPRAAVDGELFPACLGTDSVAATDPYHSQGPGLGKGSSLHSVGPSALPCGVSLKAPVPKVLLGEALGLLVHLLFYTLLQTFSVVTKRNHILLHHSQLPTCLDLPLTPCFSFAGSMVKAQGAGT